MTHNRIRERLLELHMSQADIAAKMPDDVGRVGLSFIATGKVLPTKDGMKVLCDALDCGVSDLYDVKDIDIAASCEFEFDEVNCISDTSVTRRSSHQHDGMTEFRCWIRPYEKDALEKAVDELGYRSLAEWFREVCRNTVHRNIRLQGKGDKKTYAKTS